MGLGRSIDIVPGTGFVTIGRQNLIDAVRHFSDKILKILNANDIGDVLYIIQILLQCKSNIMSVEVITKKNFESVPFAVISDLNDWCNQANIKALAQEQ